jgi:NAD(P)-dependent dehydrogenase (short-subunit alcohol dehydrogenase family)
VIPVEGHDIPKIIDAIERAKEDIVALEADLGKSTMSCLFKEAFPDRYFEMGIAEQNMTSPAAGFALAGKIPFTGTFVVFAAGRAYDQIRCAVAIPRANVKICGSSCGLIGHKYATEAYTVTKDALTLMTKTVGVRYAKDNIRCNSLHPSTVDTPLVQALFKDPAKKAERLGEVPLGRLGTALDVANAALFLASDEAAFLNGVSLPVDGGLTAY